jgi:hypothetical protein
MSGHLPCDPVYRIGSRVDDADEQGHLVLRPPDDHLNIVLRQPCEETTAAEGAVVLVDRHHRSVRVILRRLPPHLIEGKARVGR